MSAPICTGRQRCHERGWRRLRLAGNAGAARVAWIVAGGVLALGAALAVVIVRPGPQLDDATVTPPSPRATYTTEVVPPPTPTETPLGWVPPTVPRADRD